MCKKFDKRAKPMPLNEFMYFYNARPEEKCKFVYDHKFYFRYIKRYEYLSDGESLEELNLICWMVSFVLENETAMKVHDILKRDINPDHDIYIQHSIGIYYGSEGWK